eukprot:5032137-Prymnesium_polylepis.1
MGEVSTSTLARMRSRRASETASLPPQSPFTVGGAAARTKDRDQEAPLALPHSPLPDAAALAQAAEKATALA